MEDLMKKLLLQLSIMFLLSGCGGAYPFDTYNENYEIQHELDELSPQSDMYDEYLESKWDSYSETASVELQEFDDAEYSDYDYSNSSYSCPYGCTYHKNGCDIKGNISFNSGEKIYHLPWQEYYSETIINPDYGERWFCTEDEARQNGWRISMQ